MAETSYYEQSSSSSASPSNCMYGLELTQEVSRYEVTGRPQAWRMRITVTDWYNVDPNIFVYMRTGPEVQGSYVDTFEAVASPVDLEEYPAQAPDEDQEPPFFRMAQIDLISRNMTLLDETWESIKADRDELIRTLANICELETDEVSRYGDFGDEETVDTITPTVPTPGGSSEPDECPADTYAALEITESDDPDFPVGTVLTESAPAEDVPTCQRTWSVDGVVNGKTLLLETSLVSHDYVCYYDGAEVATGGVGDDYNAYIFYDKPGGDGGEHTLRIVGIEGSS